MSRIGIGWNIKQPDARCMKCKRWKSADNSKGVSNFKIPGMCTLSYCEKDFKKKKRGNEK